MKKFAQNRLSPLELCVVIQSSSQLGAKLARACDYDSVAMAQFCACSPRQLQRVFARVHLAPHRWLTEQRLLHELRQLERQHDIGELESIKRSAIEMGYRRPEHFDRNFKRVFGLAPKTFLAERESALKKLGLAAAGW